MWAFVKIGIYWPVIIFAIFAVGCMIASVYKKSMPISTTDNDSEFLTWLMMVMSDLL